MFPFQNDLFHFLEGTFSSSRIIFSGNQHDFIAERTKLLKAEFNISVHSALFIFQPVNAQPLYHSDCETRSSVKKLDVRTGSWLYLKV